MNVYVYFNPDVLAIVMKIPNLYEKLQSERSSQIIVTATDGFRYEAVVDHGQVFIRNVERKEALTAAAWELVYQVTIWDDFTDQRVVNLMSSGEHDGVNDPATHGTVKIITHAAGDVIYDQAEIKINAPTWDQAINLHHAILFGKRPNRPYGHALSRGRWNPFKWFSNLGRTLFESDANGSLT